jgi:hypothetical protein
MKDDASLTTFTTWLAIKIVVLAVACGVYIFSHDLASRLLRF